MAANRSSSAQSYPDAVWETLAGIPTEALWIEIRHRAKNSRREQRTFERQRNALIIKTLRQNLEKTLDEFAELYGCSAAYMHRIESGSCPLASKAMCEGLKKRYPVEWAAAEKKWHKI